MIPSFHRAAFTLIELSIVLVIIGLIGGAITLVLLD
jgi:prepilin-type N-terminal cleavage/methylation domain-containing protein